MPSVEPASPAGAREALGAAKAVIFDWDGVLARTMEDNYEAWSEALGAVGVKPDRREYFLLEGAKAVEVARHFLAGRGSETGLAESVSRRKDEIFLSRRPGALYPAARECVSRLLSAGKSLALVTGASRMRIQGTGFLESLPGFSAVITGDDVQRGKPDPEPYLEALRRLSLAAEECLVVENAPLGIRSAKAAGLRCVALTTTLPGEFLSEADWILGGLEELIRWME